MRDPWRRGDRSADRGDPASRASGSPIFLIHASCGSGHLRAAKAVHAALVEAGIDRARTIDILEEAPDWYRRLYRDGYAFLVQKAPRGWGCLYRWSDRSSDGSRRVLESVERWIVRRFVRRITEERPAAVLCTHYLPLYLLGALKTRGVFPGALLGAVTDYGLHRLWVHAATDGYVVADAGTESELARCGVASHRIHVTGIPIHPVFGRPFDRKRLRRRLDIPADRPLVLILSGGIGVGRLDRLLEHLQPLAESVTFVASSAGNPALHRALERIRARAIPGLRIIGYVGNIHEYMAAADLLVTKPGGLTVSEALALGLPLILVDPIPGQEEANARFLVGRGAACWAEGGPSVLASVERLLWEPEQREALRVRMASLARPRAARDVARLLLARAALLPGGSSTGGLCG
jgi:processive 1,2-diacylglycerol beta-glucosyltransferase